MTNIVLYLCWMPRVEYLVVIEVDSRFHALVWVFLLVVDLEGFVRAACGYGVRLFLLISSLAHNTAVKQRRRSFRETRIIHSPTMFRSQKWWLVLVEFARFLCDNTEPRRQSIFLSIWPIWWTVRINICIDHYRILKSIVYFRRIKLCLLRIFTRLRGSPSKSNCSG